MTIITNEPLLHAKFSTKADHEIACTSYKKHGVMAKHFNDFIGIYEK
jgi:hypothetical protein